MYDKDNGDFATHFDDIYTDGGLPGTAGIYTDGGEIYTREGIYTHSGPAVPYRVCVPHERQHTSRGTLLHHVAPMPPCHRVPGGTAVLRATCGTSV